MYSENPAYSKNISILCLLAFAWFVYLSTISPTVFYRDTPEFVSTAFSLGISHPAGFPIYNLMAKAATFFPMGAIPFKVNLFSSLMACLALGVLYLVSVTLLRVLVGPGQSDSYSWAALLPVCFMAFCLPFWSNTMQAEVYTLHTLFTVLIIWGLLKWKETDDIRYLYSTALIYGLSAGNHGTVAFYLPAIIILFLFWCRSNPWKHLSRCILLFLWGFSIYLYLPIRSMAEPTFDWGNPETLQGFLFQITDRKDSNTHFDALSQAASAAPAVVAESGQSALSWITGLLSKIWSITTVFIMDIRYHLSWLSVVGFLVGAVICFRKSLPFFIFCAVIAGTNIAFFTLWRGEAFLPSYVIVSLLTTLFIYYAVFTRWWKPFVRNTSDEPLEKVILHKPGPLSIRWGKLAFVLAALMIPWTMIDRNYSRVDHSWNHLSELLTRQVYLTLPDRAVFVTGLSWFFYNYNQDVRRLRDDVTAVTVWDLLSPHRTGLLTAKRYPNLVRPNDDQHDLKSLEGISNYAREFLESNSRLAPVVMEHNTIMYDQTDFTSRWQPYRNVLLQFGAPDSSAKKHSHQRSWDEFKTLLGTELSRPHSSRDLDWLNNPRVWMYSMRQYFHDTQQYQLEREVLTTIGGFLGQTVSRLWAFRNVDNLIADHRLDEAQAILNQIIEKYPKSFDAVMGVGLLHRARGQFQEALDAFRKAEKLRPGSFRVHLEIARTLKNLKMNEPAQAAFLRARSYVTNVRELTTLRRELN